MVPRGAPWLFLLAVLGSCWVGADQHGWVAYRDGRLSVAFESVALEHVLVQTEQATGVEFVIDPKVSGRVSRQFEDAALENGIRQLLAGYNYIMLFDGSRSGEKRVERVMVLGEISERASPPGGRQAPTRTSQVAGSIRARSAGASEVVLKRHQSGHYLSLGKINRAAVRFLVDTGATVVAVSDDMARRLGLRYGLRRTVDTANGRTDGYETVLGSVSLGGLRMEQVKAVILPDMQTDGRVLLGMSFLEGFELIQRDGTLTIRPWGSSRN
jgi:aspartyl protease family protein